MSVNALQIGHNNNAIIFYINRVKKVRACQESNLESSDP